MFTFYTKELIEAGIHPHATLSTLHTIPTLLQGKSNGVSASCCLSAQHRVIVPCVCFRTAKNGKSLGEHAFLSFLCTSGCAAKLESRSPDVKQHVITQQSWPQPMAQQTELLFYERDEIF